MKNKSIQQLVEYYYTVWKQSDGYVRKRDVKRGAKLLAKVIEVHVPQESPAYLDDADLVKLNGVQAEEANEENHCSNSASNRLLCVSCQCLKLTPNFGLSFNGKQIASGHFKELNNNGQLANDSNENLLARTNNSDKLVQFESIQSNWQQDYLPIRRGNYEHLCNECWIYWKKYGAFKYNYLEVSNGRFC